MELGQGWLQECKYFCDFYVNNALIPVVVQAGPLRVHVCGPCTPFLCLPHPHGEEQETFPCSVLGRPPSPSPTLVLFGVGVGGSQAQGWGCCSIPSRVSAMPRK